MNVKNIGRLRLAAAFVIVALIASSFGAAYVRATISSTPSAVDSQYSCEKGVAFIMSVDDATPPNYYAVAGSGTTTTPCGTLKYGGPTNVTGTSFSAVLQAAINSAGANGGGTISFGCGKYVATAPITDGGFSGITLTSQGACSTIAVSPGFAHNLFDIEQSYWSISGLKFDGRNMAASGTHSTLEFGLSNNVKNERVSGNTFIDGDLVGTYFLAVTSSTITGNFFLDNATGPYQGIVLQGNLGLDSANVVTYNTMNFTGGHGTQKPVGISIEKGVTNSGVGFNTIVGVNGTSIQLSNLMGSAPGINTGITVSDNAISAKLKNVVAIGVYGQTTFDGADNSIISGNALAFPSNDTTQPPIPIEVLGGLNLEISRNTVTGIFLNGGAAIYLKAATGGGTANCKQISVNANTVTVSSSGYYAVDFVAGCSYSSVTNNNFNGVTANTGIVLAASDTHMVVGLNMVTGFGWAFRELGAGDQSNTITGNDFSAATASPKIVYYGTLDIVTNNIGINPVASSTYTACASVCTYTNVDGYDETFMLSAINGMSAWTCNAQAMPITLTDVVCPLAPGGVITITWTVTAPTFNKVPLVA